ncbi:hypothetical protein OW493_06405 [Cobetia sp. 14N.309.X.WAT.E.A4]|uniref:hypothetical protein n=1 Tax=Cobetia sp. 14N.309.X.WAT.E.A4 TaxID=2998323 RepID=UPI0025AF25BC|nr:hypothetical protein [Cobetia sp. 14N.309.X.WAT.E.A4]MDN2656076.1 hypothetical protein [Cobetia sp. 14N.309.X.WAT.E.A4]
MIIIVVLVLWPDGASLESGPLNPCEPERWKTEEPESSRAYKLERDGLVIAMMLDEPSLIHRNPAQHHAVLAAFCPRSPAFIEQGSGRAGN